MPSKTPRPADLAKQVAALEKKLGRKICGARKRDGSPCTSSPVQGKNRCRMHGGKAPEGAAHPQFKHGRFVGQKALHRKAVPAHLRDVFDQALADPDLIVLREQLSIANGFLHELMVAKRDNGGTADQWKAVGDILKRYWKAKFEGDKPDPEDAIAEIQAAVDLHKQTALIQEQILDQQELIRRLSESEVKRLKAASEAVSRDKAIALAGALILAVRDAVGSPEAVAAVQQRFVEIVPGILGMQPQGIPLPGMGDAGA